MIFLLKKEVCGGYDIDLDGRRINAVSIAPNGPRFTLGQIVISSGIIYHDYGHIGIIVGFREPFNNCTNDFIKVHWDRNDLSCYMKPNEIEFWYKESEIQKLSLPDNPPTLH